MSKKKNEKEDRKCAYTYKIDCSTGCKSEHSTQTQHTQTHAHKNNNNKSNTCTHIRARASHTVAHAQWRAHQLFPQSIKSSSIDYRYIESSVEHFQFNARSAQVFFLFSCFSLQGHTHVQIQKYTLSHTHTHCVLPSPALSASPFLSISLFKSCVVLRPPCCVFNRICCV